VSVCSRCGKNIEFRYVDGVCTPLHFEGGCTADRSSSVNDYSGSRESKESTCFLTECPDCGDSVYFIRYNGGSVWLDPPLGYPWYKHPCLYSNAGSNKKTLLDEIQNLDIYKRKETGTNYIIGIVKETCVEENKRYTDINFQTGKDESCALRLKYNAGFLLGRVCIRDLANRTIWPFHNEEYVFKEYDQNNPVLIESVTLRRPKKVKIKWVECPICFRKINSKYKRKHMEWCSQ